MQCLRDVLVMRGELKSSLTKAVSPRVKERPLKRALCQEGRMSAEEFAQVRTRFAALCADQRTEEWPVVDTHGRLSGSMTASHGQRLMRFLLKIQGNVFEHLVDPPLPKPNLVGT